MSLRRRNLCQYCEAPLGWFAALLRFWTCNECAYRMSMGGSPLRPPPTPPLPDSDGRSAAGSVPPD